MDLIYRIKSIWDGKGSVREARIELEKVGDAAQKADPKTKKLNDTTSGFSSTLKSLVGAGLLLGAGRQLVQFGKDSIVAASAVEEMQSKFDIVFGSEAASVTAALDEFSSAANRSKTTLMGYAATLQDTFVPLGFARDTAADMSVQLVKLAEDLGSFNDIDTATVVRDLQSALVGNTETLRKYGVVAQETQIKAEALATGLWDGTGAIDAQSKAQAILQLTLKGTTDAQGDAIKTADSYANVSKGLEAAVLDLKVAFGESLIPTMTEAKGVATEFVSGLGGLISASNNLRQAEKDGIITHGEYLKLQARLTYGALDAAGAVDILSQKYGIQQRELERLGETAAAADNVFQNYISTQEEVIARTEEAIRGAGGVEAYRMGVERSLSTEEARAVSLANSADEQERANTATAAGVTASEAYIQAIKDQNAALDALIETGGRTVSETTQASYREAVTAFQQNEDLVKSGARVIEEKLTGVYTGLEDTGVGADIASGQVGDYITRLGEIPTEVETRLTLRYTTVGGPGGNVGEAGDPTRYAAGGYGNQGSYGGSYQPDYDPLDKLPKFASGGIVPGPTGRPMLAIVHGGETVIPNGKSGATIQNLTINVMGVGGGRMMGKQIASTVATELGRLN